ncbi:ATP-binding cassette domain-containing protein, partial [Gilvimarinus sp. 1_MG-2023]
HPHSDDDILAALALVQLDEWAMQLPQGLDTWLGDGEWQASGGECKRLGLARLVLQQPRIILLDEPGAGMDVDLAQQVFANLADHWQ